MVGLVALALPPLLISVDFTVLHLAVPHLSAALAPTATQQLWIVDSYGFAVAGLLITVGTLGTGSVAASCCWSGRPRSAWPRTVA